MNNTGHSSLHRSQTALQPTLDNLCTWKSVKL